MTRQNQIPTPDGARATFGLIPLWDMCNHTNGYVGQIACHFCMSDWALDNDLHLITQTILDVSVTLYVLLVMNMQIRKPYRK